MFDGAVNGAIAGLAVGVVIALIALIGKFAGGGVKAGPDGMVLRYGGKFRGLGLLCVGISALVLVLYVGGRLTGLGSQSPGSGQGAAVLIGLFLAIGLPTLAEGYRRQVTLSDHGIAARGWWGPAGEFAWDGITKVENRVGSSKFVVRAGKKKIALSHYLDGLDVFVAECQKRLDPAVYAKEFEKPLNRMFM